MSPSPSPDLWLPYRRPLCAPRLRLVALPFAGGGASIYRLWPDGLPLDVELCAIQLPGRETRFREPAYSRMTDLIPALADVVVTLCDRPIVLFGHSMGALIAFELARELRRCGAPRPELLIVSGFAAPHLPPRGPDLHALPEDEFRTELRRLNGTPQAVLDNDELLSAFLPTLRGDFGLCETHSFSEEPPLAVPILACGGMLDVRAAYADLDAWRAHTSADFNLRIFPGDHFFLQSHREALVAHIESRLRFARTVPNQPLEPWPDSEIRERPSPNHIHVWRIDFDDNLVNLSRLESVLSSDERERAAGFHFKTDRERYIVGRAALRHILGGALDRGPETVQLCYNSHGKPGLVRAAGEPDIRFNLAHSGGFGLAALSVGQSVGIDIEQVRPEVECRQLARRFFAPAEADELIAMPESNQVDAFFRIWTRKEAYLKAHGVGLSLPLDQFRVSLQEPARLLATEHDPAQRDRWSLISLEPAEGFLGALAVEGRGHSVVLGRWKLKE